MKKRISIDESLCDGCGQCLPACAEGAIEIIDGKARLTREDLCDGLGACIGNCPRGAISIMEEVPINSHHATCPSASPMSSEPTGEHSLLANWPVQISLLPLTASFFLGARLTVSADCVPFAYRDFHHRFIQGKKICTGCPKLDDIGFYEGKLGKIISLNEIKEIEVAYMEVPCCAALARAVIEARRGSGKSIPLRLTRVGIDGHILKSELI